MRSILLMLCALVALAPPARAQVDVSDVVSVSLLPGWRQADGVHVAALDIRLAPGWKTYWRSPGEGGIPPQVVLSAGGNVAGHRLRWPAPEVFWTNGLRSIGYVGGVLLPLEIETQGPGPVRIDGVVDMGVCQDICIPVRLSLAGELPQGGSRDVRIATALAAVPLTAAEAGAGPVRCALSPIADGLRLQATIPVAPQGGAEAVVVEAPGEIWVDEAQVARSGNTLTAVTDLVPPVPGAFALDRSDLTFTVLGDHGAVELHGCTG